MYFTNSNKPSSSQHLATTSISIMTSIAFDVTADVIHSSLEVCYLNTHPKPTHSSFPFLNYWIAIWHWGYFMHKCKLHPQMQSGFASRPHLLVYLMLATPCWCDFIYLTICYYHMCVYLLC